MQVYVLGFIFDPEMKRVVLMRKNRPEFLEGLLNGIGGKLEELEIPVEAMARECAEECGLDIPRWDEVGEVNDFYEEFLIYVFSATYENIDEAKTLTDEEIEIIDIEKLGDYELAPNADEIIEYLKENFYK